MLREMISRSMTLLPQSVVAAKAQERDENRTTACFAPCLFAKAQVEIMSIERVAIDTLVYI